MLTAYVFMRLMQDGRLTLHTRAAEVLDWWNPYGGGCHNVTVGHLLTQTGSLDMYPLGIGQCRSSDTLGCAREAYSTSCSRRPLGSVFAYGETTFHVLGAIALAVTGLPTYNDVFRKYLAGPLHMSESCAFDNPNLSRSDPGGGCRCNILDYGRFLRAALADEIVPAELRQRAELPLTLFLSAGSVYHPGRPYGFGQWRECPPLNRDMPTFRERCSDAMGVKVSSMGMAGYYPWMFRKGEQSHWGILARYRPGTTAISYRVGGDIFPLAVEAVESFRRSPQSAQRDVNGSSVQRAFALLHEEGGPTLAIGSAFAVFLVVGVFGLLWRLCARMRKGSASYAALDESVGQPPQKIGAESSGVVAPADS